MKILHVVPYFAPAWAFGGTPRAVYEIAFQQVRNGHDVSVLTSDALSKKQRTPKLEEMVSGVKVFRVRNASQKLVWNFHFLTIWKLPKGVDLTSFDVIHLHETRTLLHFLVLQHIDSSQKVIFSPWGTLPYNDRLIFVKKIMDFFLVPLLKEKVSVGTGQNKHELEVLRSFQIGKRQHILPLGVSTNFFSKLPSKRISRQKLQIPSDKTAFLFLGRFSREKGLELLLRSFAEFAKRHADVILVCVGRDDGYLSDMKKIIAELSMTKKIFIKKPLYNRERLYAYRAANVFVYTPIIYEETSTACLEALFCGVPVITTKQAAIPFLKKNNGVTEVVAEKSTVVRAMNEMMRKKKMTIQQQKIKTYFSWQGIVKKLDRLYVEKH